MADGTNSLFVLAPTSGTNTTISAVSTAAVPIGYKGRVRFVALGTNTNVLFGDSSVSAATTSNSIAIPSNTYMDFYCGTPSSTHFRAIGAGAGALVWSYIGG